jgi:hypothetical protein
MDFAQDDRILGVVEENKQRQGPIQGSFASLRMTGFLGGVRGGQVQPQRQQQIALG